MTPTPIYLPSKTPSISCLYHQNPLNPPSLSLSITRALDPSATSPLTSHNPPCLEPTEQASRNLNRPTQSLFRMSTTRDEISIKEDVREKCHLGDRLAMYVSRFVVVSMTRFSIEIGMKDVIFIAEGLV